jgi:hypothetical protein
VEERVSQGKRDYPGEGVDLVIEFIVGRRIGRIKMPRELTF